MRKAFIAIVALSLVTIGAASGVADTQETEESEDMWTFVGMDADGQIYQKEVSEDKVNELDDDAECDWDPVTAFCSTGDHGESTFLLHGFLIPTGTTVGDFQSNLVGVDGNTAQFQCSLAYAQGSEVAPLDCRSSDGSSFPVSEAFSHDCYSYPYGAIGTVPGLADPSSPGVQDGQGIPGGVNAQQSTLCIVTHFDFFF